MLIARDSTVRLVNVRNKIPGKAVPSASAKEKGVAVMIELCV